MKLPPPVPPRVSNLGAQGPGVACCARSSIWSSSESVRKSLVIAAGEEPRDEVLSLDDVVRIILVDREHVSSSGSGPGHRARVAQLGRGGGRRQAGLAYRVGGGLVTCCRAIGCRRWVISGSNRSR